MRNISFPRPNERQTTSYTKKRGNEKSNQAMNNLNPSPWMTSPPDQKKAPPNTTDNPPTNKPIHTRKQNTHTSYSIEQKANKETVSPQAPAQKSNPPSNAASANAS
jgi:hypothetical protein